MKTKEARAAYTSAYGLVKTRETQGPVECVVLCMKNGEQRALIRKKKREKKSLTAAVTAALASRRAWSRRNYTFTFLHLGAGVAKIKWKKKNSKENIHMLYAQYPLKILVRHGRGSDFWWIAVWKQKGVRGRKTLTDAADSLVNRSDKYIYYDSLILCSVEYLMQS